MDFQVNVALLGFLVPVVVGVVQAVKLLVAQPTIMTRVSPVLSILLGILGVWILPTDLQTGMRVITGVLVGLAASGLYSVAKTTTEAINDDNVPHV